MVKVSESIVKLCWDNPVISVTGFKPSEKVSDVKETKKDELIKKINTYKESKHYSHKYLCEYWTEKRKIFSEHEGLISRKQLIKVLNKTDYSISGICDQYNIHNTKHGYYNPVDLIKFIDNNTIVGLRSGEVTVATLASALGWSHTKVTAYCRRHKITPCRYITSISDSDVRGRNLNVYKLDNFVELL